MKLLQKISGYKYFLKINMVVLFISSLCVFYFGIKNDNLLYLVFSTLTIFISSTEIVIIFFPSWLNNFLKTAMLVLFIYSLFVFYSGIKSDKQLYLVFSTLTIIVSIMGIVILFFPSWLNKKILEEKDKENMVEDYISVKSVTISELTITERFIFNYSIYKVSEEWSEENNFMNAILKSNNTEVNQRFEDGNLTVIKIEKIRS